MKRKQMAGIIFLTSITALSFTLSCSKTVEIEPYFFPGMNDIWLQNSTFLPNPKTIYINNTVVWINKDSYAHTVTSDSTLFDSGNIPAGGTNSYTFTTAGTYNYHCNYHTMMKGTIVVQ